MQNTVGDLKSEMTTADVAEQWRECGFVVFPGFVNRGEVAALRRICDRVLAQAIAADSTLADARNIAYLTDRKYFLSRDNELVKLLEFVADERILSLLAYLSGEIPLFHNSQYFYNPASKSHDGEWHRDTQFLAPDSALERARMKGHTGVHFRVAFLADQQLEYVPGSEQRWDTPEELAIRKGLHPDDPDMPGHTTIKLKAGDACLFHAWGIHRGTYKTDIPRRTLDLIYGWGGLCDYVPPPPTCFTDRDLVARPTPGAREFFRYFMRSYESFWQQG